MSAKLLYLSCIIWLPLLQAQPVIAPSPDRPGFALGADLSSYNVTNSFETGYRFSAVGGDYSLYRTQGLGNDPYQVATFRIEKNDVYRYDMNWRLSDYFNPSLDNGESDTLKNTRRVMQDHDLSVSLAKWAKLKLGYSRNTTRTTRR